MSHKICYISGWKGTGWMTPQYIILYFLQYMLYLSMNRYGMDDSTRRITQQKQTLDEAYSPPGKHPSQILKHIRNIFNSPPGKHPLQILKK